jgi:hypothetical protein
MANKKRYWHYTTLEKAAAIRGTGAIQTAKTGLASGVAPAVWFSTNPEWEATIYKDLLDAETGEQITLYTRDDFLKYGKPPVRIEVDPKMANLRGWNNYKKNSGDDRQTIKALEKTAKSLGANHKEWYVSFNDVSLNCVLSVEIWTGNDWINLKDIDEDEQVRLQQMET